ncbi:hypothetical protein F4779DRAFT_619522 [Xylariaceae sp. FL0662B]|nr:hypothetical protein F4779DRAFT_619522 [Xylariaceae sp. FL0662B]
MQREAAHVECPDCIQGAKIQQSISPKPRRRMVFALSSDASGVCNRLWRRNLDEMKISAWLIARDMLVATFSCQTHRTFTTTAGDNGFNQGLRANDLSIQVRSSNPPPPSLRVDVQGNAIIRHLAKAFPFELLGSGESSHRRVRIRPPQLDATRPLGLGTTVQFRSHTAAQFEWVGSPVKASRSLRGVRGRTCLDLHSGFTWGNAN